MAVVMPFDELAQAVASPAIAAIAELMKADDLGLIGKSGVSRGTRRHGADCCNCDGRSCNQIFRTHESSLALER
jgi:hypothetical protein